MVRNVVRSISMAWPPHDLGTRARLRVGRRAWHRCHGTPAWRRSPDSQTASPVSASFGGGEEPCRRSSDAIPSLWAHGNAALPVRLGTNGRAEALNECPRLADDGT